MKTGRSDCESDDDEPSRPSSEMDEEYIDQPSDPESDQHSNEPEGAGPKKGILKSRPNSSCLGIIDILDEEAKARWTACDGSMLLRQRSSSSLSYSSNKRTPRRINYAGKTTGASKRPHSAKRPETENKKSNVVTFSRSLKLLGLEPEDFGIKKAESTDTVNKVPRKVTVRAPTIHTRVLERSVSLDALRSALHESASTKKCVSTEQLDRETIAKAVYEEWYFKKLEEARRKRELLLIEERKAKEELERVRAERLRKSEENFARWKEAKLKERKNVDTKKKPIRPRPGFAVPVSKEKADEAFYAWKKEKEKCKELEIESKQSELEKEKEKEKARQEKRMDAINTFNAWKKQADEKLRKQQLDREIKKKKAEEKEAREKQERAANSCTSFSHWKSMKDELAKKEVKERRLAIQTAEQETKMNQYDRLYEAEQAFEEWLDDVEERRQRRARARRGPWPGPPWSPAGKIS